LKEIWVPLHQQIWQYGLLKVQLNPLFRLRLLPQTDFLNGFNELATNEKMSSRKWTDDDFTVPQISPPSLKQIGCSSAKNLDQKEGLLLKSDRKVCLFDFQRV
jgi:hypothetical protein